MKQNEDKIMIMWHFVGRSMQIAEHVLKMQ